MFERAFDDGSHHFAAGHVAEGVDDAVVTVAAFAAERDLAGFLVEVGSPVDEFLDATRGFADDHIDDGGVAECAAGDERVVDMFFKTVVGVHDAGDAALGVGAVGLLDGVFRDDEGAQLVVDGVRRP